MPLSKFNASSFSKISSSLRSGFEPYAAKTASSSFLGRDNHTPPLHDPGVLPGRSVGQKDLAFDTVSL
jgi:hypothetical protein